MGVLNKLCHTLQDCTEKLEEEIKVNLNDLQNLAHSHSLSETKLSLEQAKDYHYKEILTAITEILKNIKIILFHEDKVQWLSDEVNFTNDELKRYSYVRRQVYAFSKTEGQEKPTEVKKEIRPRASEISIGSLETWEKYLDQKENVSEERVDVEVQKTVLKRSHSNVRRRKKFVSSTVGAFLEDGGHRRKNLDSIIEDVSSADGSERLSLDSREEEHIFDKSKKNQTVSFYDNLEGLDDTDKEDLNGSGNLDDLGNKILSFYDNLNEISKDTKMNGDSIDGTYLCLDTDKDIEEFDNFATNNNAVSVDNPGTLKDVVEQDSKRTKPKIVDVVFKKKPC